jgi:hypothetical protein
MMKGMEKEAGKRNSFAEGMSGAECTDGFSVTEWKSLGRTYAGLSKTLDEPLQGNAKNCFFISALKAVAFKASGRLSTSSTKFTFLNTVANPMIEEALTLNDDKVAIYNTVNNQVYARCTTSKYWPMLYEKAYALWLDSKNSQQHWDPVDPTQPNIKTIFEGGGNGITAMMHIARYKNNVEKGALSWEGNIPKYPTIAATKQLAAADLKLPDQLTPKHTYVVYQKDATYYYLKDPCNNSVKKLEQAKLTDTKFDTWGYVYP